MYVVYLSLCLCFCSGFVGQDCASKLTRALDEMRVRGVTLNKVRLTSFCVCVFLYLIIIIIFRCFLDAFFFFSFAFHVPQFVVDYIGYDGARSSDELAIVVFFFFFNIPGF